MRKLILLLLAVLSTSLADTVAIINIDTNAGNLSSADVRALYLMKYRRWSDGQLVVLFQMPPESAAHRAFVRDVMGMSLVDYEKEWNRVVSSGLSSKIHYVTSSDEMLKRVRLTRNSIGYINSDNIIINSGANDVKILHVVAY